MLNVLMRRIRKEMKGNGDKTETKWREGRSENEEKERRKKKEM